MPARRISYIIIFILSLFCRAAYPQQNFVTAPSRIRSLQLITDGDPLLPPVIRLGSHKQIELNFDEMGHNYHRLLYFFHHVGYDWSDEGESLFESDYFKGVNLQPLDDYDISFNTTQLYTHYRLLFPSPDIQFLLSGNYQLEIFDEDELEASRDAAPLLRAEFCVVETGMSVSAQVSTNTDIDFNANHQQLTYAVSYGSLSVTDPLRQLHTIVKQNRRDDNAVRDLQPNIVKSGGIEFTHRKELIFPAGNEFHKFETIDMHRPNLNIDNLRWYEPFYHFTVFPDRPGRNYVYDQDTNGCFILRNAEYDDEELTSEYAWVHFILQTGEPLPGGDIYVCGAWTNGTWDPQCLMSWNEELKEYEGSAYLKQGYYNYQYRQLSTSSTGEAVGSTALTDGDFCQTENEYSIYIYYRPLGGRYDQLVNYSTINSN